MAKASDCGSEDRGFESHYPPHKKWAPFSGAHFLWNSVNNGTRRGRRQHSCRKKQSGGLFFSPGESPAPPGASQRQDCVAPFSGAHFLWNSVNNGTRRGRRQHSCRKKQSGGLFFSPGESPAPPGASQRHTFLTAPSRFSSVDKGWAIG